MLQIPFKRGQRVDIARPCQAYLRSVYGKSEAKSHGEALAALEQMRNDVRTLASPNDAAREALLRYMAQIRQVREKLPVSDAQIKIRFGWDDSFTGKQLVGQCNWDFEYAALLYNLAALESQRGAGLARDSKASIIEVAKHFQLAAGILTHIRDEVVGKLLGVMPIDLSAEGLNFFIHIFLAQAQVCFFEMADQHLDYPPDRVAKIALAAADEYRAANKSLTPDSMKAIERAYPYSKHLAIQSASLDSVAYLHHAKVVFARAEETTVGYGEQVGFLQLALRAAETAKATLAASKAAIAVRPLAALLQQVKDAYDAAATDNRNVYRQGVPTPSELPPVPATLLAKPAALPPLAPATPTADLFATLVPASVSKAVESLLSRHAEFCAKLRADADRSAETAKATLSSMGLPGSLDAGESATGIPDALWAKCDRVRINGGADELTKLRDANAAAGAAISRGLDDVESKLRGDYQEHEANRARFGSAWTAADHREYMGEHIGKLMSLRSAVASFRSRDTELAKRVSAVLDSVASVSSSSREELAAAVPHASTGGGGAAERTELRAALVAMHKLLEARPALVDNLCKASDKSSLSRACMSVVADRHGPSTVELSDDDIAAAAAIAAKDREPHKEVLAASFAEQSSLLERITALNTRYNEVRSEDPASAARQAALQKLHDAADTSERLRSTLREQAELYADVQREVSRLDAQVSDSRYVRDIERRDLLVRLGGGGGGGNGGNGGGAASGAGGATVVAPP